MYNRGGSHIQNGKAKWIRTSTWRTEICSPVPGSSNSYHLALYRPNWPNILQIHHYCSFCSTTVLRVIVSLIGTNSCHVIK